jgi:DNA polymerase-3 subunit gamma/tau
MDKIADMDTLAPDYAQVLDAMNDILQRMAIAKEVPGALASRTDRKRLLALSQAFSSESIQLYYQIALHGRRDLYLSPTARGGFEMTCLRMLAFDPDVNQDLNQNTGNEKKNLKSVKAKTQRSVQTPQSSQSEQTVSPSLSSSAPHAAQPTPRKLAAVKNVSAVATSDALQNPEPISQSVTDTAQAPIEQSQVDVTPPELAPTVQLDDYKAELNIQNWVEYYKSLPLKGAVRQLAKHCVLAAQGLGTLSLSLDSDVAPMLSESLKLELQKAICDQEGKSVRLHIEAAEITGITPAAQEKAVATQKQKDALSAIEQDPFVQAMQKQFAVRVDKRSIKPVSQNMAPKTDGKTD